LKPNERIWLTLGVPDTALNVFREITNFRGFFITTELQKYDLELPNVANIICIYKADWQLLEEYSRELGEYAKYHLLDLFKLDKTQDRRPLRVQAMQARHKRVVSGNSSSADLFIFQASPYELLPFARVYRRDLLPDLSSKAEEKYQRALISDKLQRIREELLTDHDFMFPNSILVILSNDCKFDPDEKILQIPEIYGSVEVIDGQHRLFSYASKDVKTRVGDRGQIMVTAIRFNGTRELDARHYSAKTFIEINTNQTRVPPTHIDAIRYPILGEKGDRAIAAQVILRANARKGALYGFFDTNQTGLGIISTTTVFTHLKPLSNIEEIKKLRNPKSDSQKLRRIGYEKLFAVASIEELDEAQKLIEQGTICITRYFDLVKKVFHHDWPQRGQDNPSSLKFAKLIAGFVKLLNQFVAEGMDWKNVEADLEQIKVNLIALRKPMKRYNKVLFDPEHRHIPDARPSANDDFHFLHMNRQKPTSINNVRGKRRR
jgi:DGQHR domain-containing protein